MFSVKYSQIGDDFWFSSYAKGLTATEIINRFARFYNYGITEIKPHFTDDYLVAYGYDLNDDLKISIWCFIVNKIKENF